MIKKLSHFVAMMLFVIIFITVHNAYALSNSDMPSSTPENATTYTYTDNTVQEQFTIPAVVAIVSVVVGIAIYTGAKTRKK
ncbi:MAG: hypothetical protein ACREA8_05375 [Nitrosotalea sp.]